MLRFQIPDIAWGVLFGIFATIVLVGSALKYFPSPLEMFGDGATDCHQPAIDAQEKAKSGKDDAKDDAAILHNAQPSNHEKESEAKKSEYECLIAKYTGGLAAFTRWLVYVTFLLALFGFWQVMVSRNTARRQLRAYVFVTQAKFMKLPGHSEFLIFVQFTNTGQTPAYKLTILSDKKVAEYPLKTDLIPREQPTIVGSLGAGQHSRIGVSAPTLTEIERQEMSKGKLAVYVFGRIEYKDAFRRKRWTTYTFIGGGPAPIGPDRELAIHAESSNDAN
jgi:hypothetical protein